jgi:twinkle protein
MAKREKGRFLEHQECEKCGSSDAYGAYDDGWGTCFSCNASYKWEKEGVEKVQEEIGFVKEAYTSQLNMDTIKGYATRGFRERNIPKHITEFFGVKAATDIQGNVTEHFYPYGIDATVGYKIRKLPKEFRSVGTIEGLFGQQLFNGGKRLIIVEGELDALSVAYAYDQKYSGKIYPVVSLPSASGMKALLQQREWVRQFDEVVLMLDNDAAGQKALAEACKIVGVDKARIAKLKTKDANESLIKHGHMSILEAIWNAQPWSPAGILQGEELWEKLLERQSTESIPYPLCLQGVNDKVNGMRFGEVDLFTSGTGSGKSTVIKEIVLSLKEATEDSIGIISLEESPGDTVEKFLGMYMQKNLADYEATPEEERKAFDDVFGDKRIKLLDHQGSVSDDSLMDKIETLCLMGCKYLILDHLTIAVSEVDSSDVNGAIDKVMSDILKTAKKHNVWFGVISHLRKTGLQSTSFEEGKLPSMDDIKGSGSIKQISFQIIAFARNMIAGNEAERNTIKVRVLKSRFTGRTGDAGGAFFDSSTGRLSYVSHDFNAEPEL